MGKILLFYKYTEVNELNEIALWQKKLCVQLKLKGRIILASEGINGTIGGTDKATTAYIRAMNNHHLFSVIDFKKSSGSADHFPRLRIVIKKEIVHLGIDPKKLPASKAGTYLSPKKTHELINKGPCDLVLLDTRNRYESAIGTFTGAIKSNITHFRQFPTFVNNNSHFFKDKQVLMFCTGGIRCERASAYLKQKRIAKNVYQLQGGIHRYIEQFPNGHFRGSNYVFDGRIEQKVNDDVLSTCTNCTTPSDYYMNCVNAECNKQFLICVSCLKTLKEACSRQCFSLVKQHKVIIRSKQTRV